MFPDTDVGSLLQAPGAIEEARQDNPAEELDEEDGEVLGCQGKPFKPRKRQKNESQREKAKRLRNTGESYINVKGNIVPAKIFTNVDCGCPKRCFA